MFASRLGTCKRQVVSLVWKMHTPHVHTAMCTDPCHLPSQFQSTTDRNWCIAVFFRVRRLHKDLRDLSILRHSPYHGFVAIEPTQTVRQCCITCLYYLASNAVPPWHSRHLVVSYKFAFDWQKPAHETQRQLIRRLLPDFEARGLWAESQGSRVHAGTAEAMQRYSALAADFKARYGEPAQLFARAPGRVNIIGEHVDYEGCAACSC